MKTEKTAPPREAMWEEGWNGHEQAQLHRLAKLSLAEKLRWLEEAQELVTHLARKTMV